MGLKVAVAVPTENPEMLPAGLLDLTTCPRLGSAALLSSI